MIPNICVWLGHLRLNLNHGRLHSCSTRNYLLSAADVDDLIEIGDLEGYIDACRSVLIYCSDGCVSSAIQTTVFCACEVD